MLVLDNIDFLLRNIKELIKSDNISLLRNIFELAPADDDKSDQFYEKISKSISDSIKSLGRKSLTKWKPKLKEAWQQIIDQRYSSSLMPRSQTDVEQSKPVVKAVSSLMDSLIEINVKFKNISENSFTKSYNGIQVEQFKLERSNAMQTVLKQFDTSYSNIVDPTQSVRLVNYISYLGGSSYT